MASASPSTSQNGLSEKQKQGLNWIEWLRGWSLVIYEVFFEKITARHLQNPLPLPPLGDVTCIGTGSTSGIGLEIARKLDNSGAHIFMAVRNQAAAHDIIHKWNNEGSGTNLLNIELMQLNLLSPDSVVKFAEIWNSRSKPRHVLINNAGIFSIGKPQSFSKDEFETHLHVNHLAPALLSMLLLLSLMKGSSSRIVNTNSTMHFLGFVDVNDGNFVSGRRKFTSLNGYSSSKLAQVMLSSILQKKLPAESGISVVCVNPGAVRTNVVRDLPKMVQVCYHLLPFFMFNPEEGARSAPYGAADPQVQDYSESVRTHKSPVCAYIHYDCRFANASREAHN